MGAGMGGLSAALARGEHKLRFLERGFIPPQTGWPCCRKTQ